MSELVVGQIVSVSGLLAMAGIIFWFLRGIQKDDREINKDWYERHNM